MHEMPKYIFWEKIMVPGQEGNGDDLMKSFLSSIR